MPNDSADMLRDALVLGYMLVLRILVPLWIIIFAGKWIQRRMAENDLRERQAQAGGAYCWDTRTNAQTAMAKIAADAHPELPCWLAVQSTGGGVTESCFNCSRYAVQTANTEGDPVEVG